MNEVADRADLLVLNEREMTADVSHRLLKPLTALWHDTDMLDESTVAHRIRGTLWAFNQDVVLITWSLTPIEPGGFGECDLAAARSRMEPWTVRADDQD